MDKNKLILPITIVSACIILGGFYFASQISKQRSIEKQQQIEIEQEEQDRTAEKLQEIVQQQYEEQTKEESERALNVCMANASTAYTDNWYRACKSRGSLTGGCISLNEMTLDEYKEQNPDKIGLDAFMDFYKERDECSCSLPLDNADRLNESLQDDKDECFKRYPQN